MSKIFVVDDERSIRDTFKIILERLGNEVEVSESVDEVLKLLVEEEPDLIITDIIMPRCTGLDLLEKIGEKAEDIPIIIMTGEPTVETAIEAIKSNAYDYLTKPVSKDVLIRTVEKALEYKSLKDNKKKIEAENLEYRFELEKLVDIRTESVRKILLSTISTISYMLESRDMYTAGHERRVGNLAVAIGREIGLEDCRLNSLLVAGYLHDIGKVSIPTEILSKPGKLREQEYELIKIHPEVGYNIISKMDFPWNIKDIIVQHHERVDGSGYPNGLNNDETILESRIIAVADVIEAMTSHRPYRPGLGINVAINEIEANGGILYDEEIVKATITLFREKGYVFENEAKPIKFIV